MPVVESLPYPNYANEAAFPLQMDAGASLKIEGEKSLGFNL